LWEPQSLPLLRAALLLFLVSQLASSAQVAPLLALVLVPDAQGPMAAEQVHLPHLVALCCEENALLQLQRESLMLPHRCRRRRALLQRLAIQLAVDEALMSRWLPQRSPIPCETTLP
jgi:hypothetical protein